MDSTIFNKSHEVFVHIEILKDIHTEVLHHFLQITQHKGYICIPRKILTSRHNIFGRIQRTMSLYCVLIICTMWTAHGFVLDDSQHGCCDSWYGNITIQKYPWGNLWMKHNCVIPHKFKNLQNNYTNILKPICEVSEINSAAVCKQAPSLRER